MSVRYASCKLPDDETFVILLELDDDENNPLFTVPAFRDFQAALQSRVAGGGAADAGRLVPAFLTGPWERNAAGLCQHDGMTDSRAGQPAAPGDLVDVAKLVTAYYTVHPDPHDAAQRVSFGTSGH
ncbi:MAG TPA: hypothetical protein VFE59_37550, partial [Trebonia sp.]|nr:hypothetical protein [Trebonia sp.]HEX4094048.1 hypothetical protein [Trebonia sp.]